MSGALIALTVLAGGVLLVWISRHVMINRERTSGRILDSDCEGPGTVLPIHVFVAAKDEEDNIARCVRSLLSQDYPDLVLTVVNDRSEDRTAEIVEKIARENERLELRSVEHLPEGWMGKNHAMWTAVTAADEPWLLMVDADCEMLSPRAISVAMRYAQDTGADLLSVLPILRTDSFWEHVIQPVCGGVMMIWFHPAKVNDPAKPNAYANGAFMLMKRSAYEAIGTHEAVKDQPNEDMQMALRVKRQGLKLRVIRNRGLYTVRMYSGLAQIVRGWARIFYGTFGTLKRMLVSTAVLVVVSLFPWIAAILGWSLVAGGAGPAAWALAMVGTAAAAVQISVIGRFYHLVESDWKLAATYPVGCLIVLYILLSAMAKLRSGARLVWRGTTYTRERGGA